MLFSRIHWRLRAKVPFWYIVLRVVDQPATGCESEGHAPARLLALFKLNPPPLAAALLQVKEDLSRRRSGCKNVN